MIEQNEVKTECHARYRALRMLGMRAGFLFANFFLIIMALYLLKPASRSLFIETMGADQLPYAWLGTALGMLILISFYHRLVERHNRFLIVLGSCLLFAALLVVFRALLTVHKAAAATAFFIFVDISGVILVEQFWSLTDSIYTTTQGKSWYGVIGTGGLAGGVLGGAFAAFLIKYTALRTPDLLLVASGILITIAGMTLLMARLGLYCEAEKLHQKGREAGGGWRVIGHSRYLLLITIILLLAQLASPLVEYQFLKTVELSYPLQEPRTEFLSMFFSMLGVISITINLGLTPLIHKKLGVIAGLLVQPLAMGIFSWAFFLTPTLLMGATTKISDRGLSYSINRASKELLYVPTDPVLIYQAKAWIDMFGYRIFKAFGSVVVLLFTQWSPIAVSVSQLSWVTLVICGLWIAAIGVLSRDYKLVLQRSLSYEPSVTMGM